MTLFLPEALAAQIRLQAQSAFPNECCGLIEGVRRESDFHVLALHAAPDGEADRFAIDPAAHFAAVKSARANGRAVIGCYHSHPNGRCEPSGADRSGAGQEDFVWLIAALDGAMAQPQLRAFVYSGSAFDGIGLATGADLVTSSS